MTPTEQDKELRDLLIEIKFNIRKGDKVGDVPVAHLPHIVQDIDTYLKSDDAARVIELITADRKRVALGARIDEIKLTKDNSEESYLGEDWWADESIKDNSAHEVPLSYFENRIAELKAQQEKL